MQFDLKQKTQVIMTESQSFSKSKEVQVDFEVLERIFSNQDSLFTQQPQQDIDEQEKQQILRTIKKLPEIEYHVIILLYYFHKTQKTTGKILGISQCLTFYFKKKALERLKRLLYLETIDRTRLENYLQQHLTLKQAEAMLLYVDNNDLCALAEVLRKKHNLEVYSFCSVASLIRLGMRKLKELKKTDSLAAHYYQLYVFLKENRTLGHSRSKKQLPKELE